MRQGFYRAGLEFPFPEGASSLDIVRTLKRWAKYQPALDTFPWRFAGCLHELLCTSQPDFAFAELSILIKGEAARRIFEPSLPGYHRRMLAGVLKHHPQIAGILYEHLRYRVKGSLIRRGLEAWPDCEGVSPLGYGDRHGPAGGRGRSRAGECAVRTAWRRSGHGTRPSPRPTRGTAPRSPGSPAKGRAPTTGRSCGPCSRGCCGGPPDERDDRRDRLRHLAPVLRHAPVRLPRLPRPRPLPSVARAPGVRRLSVLLRRTSVLGPRTSLFFRPLSGFNLHPSASELPDDMTPDEFRETVAFVYGPTFDFLCRTLLRREGAYIRRLLQVPERPPRAPPTD